MAKAGEQQIFDTYAIIQTGGKQYQALPGKTIAVEKIEGEAGDNVVFDQVLFRKNEDGNFEFGFPFLTSSVKATIVKQMKGPKIIAFRFRRRQKVRVKTGHRQPMTVVRIESI